MNITDSKFNVPSYVSSANPKDINLDEDSAVIVEGMRIDTKAAAWMAKASLLKSASNFSHSAIEKVDTACKLFGISDADFIEKSASSEGIITVSDSSYTATFNVVDTDTLDKAASELRRVRSGVSYLFAKDCAEALRKKANSMGLSMSEDNHIALKKMAGAYHVDFDKLREVLSATSANAASCGLGKYANELDRISNIVKNDCPEQLVPMVIEAIDQVNKALPLAKKAASDPLPPEEYIYLTSAEFINKTACDTLDVDGVGNVSAKAIVAKRGDIVKWASDCGAHISTDDSPSVVVSKINQMPKLLREEFIDIFG